MYIQNDIKDNSVYQLQNKNSRDISLRYLAFLFYFRGFPGDFPLL